MSAAPSLLELPDRYNYPGARRVNHSAARIKALDGLRGIAIAGVVAFHVGILPGGFLGVDLFFVLSGYLITSILLREHATSGTVSLHQFWTRRARRLVPAVVVLLVAAQLWARTRADPSELSVLNGQSVAAVFYVSNWFNILFDVGYWSAGPANSPLNHLWSLAIEEQFYIVFPLLLLAVFKLARIRVKTFAGMCVVLALISFALTPTLFALFGANRAYFGTDTRVGAILVGAALGAFALGVVPLGSIAASPSQSTTRGALMAGVIAVPSMLVIVALWATISTSAANLYRGGLALHGLCSVAIIVAVILNPHAAYTRALQWRPLVWLGERSYSLYLWHWPLIVILTPAVTRRHGVAQLALVAVAVTVATIVSYEMVEYPIRYSKVRGTRLVITLTIPAMFVVASALLWQPPPPPQFGTNTLVTQGNGGIRLMIAGDSWARNLGIALAKVDSTHQMSILNLGKGGCGIADAKRERSLAKGEFETPFDCSLWPDTWRNTVALVRPEVAILNVGNWDLAPQDFDGTGQFVRACHPLFAERYSQQLDRAIAVLGEQGARVFVLSIRDNDGRDGSEPDCMNALLRDVVRRHANQGVTLLDQYAQLCANHICPATDNGEPIYDATGHLGGKAQERIAIWVLNSVNETRR
ncbi:MAG: acyltransferase family protein [Gemmatimonadaceae bacterium]